LSGHEQWKRNLEQNILNMWLDHFSGALKGHALSQELDGKSKSPGTNELAFSLQNNVQVGLVQSGKMYSLEFVRECFDKVSVCNVFLVTH